jgi:hypothetical protein
MLFGIFAVTTHGIRSMALAAVLLWAGTGRANVNVSGTWNFCYLPGVLPNVQRPVGTLVQVGSHVSGTLAFPFFGGGFLPCTIGAEIDSTTGAFVPGTHTETCALGATIGTRPAIATAGRIDAEYIATFDTRAAFYGLRACDPMTTGACDDGDPSTTDTCSTTVDCFGVALAPSCIHTGCTTDDDCMDASNCTYDRCDAVTGCAHPILLQPGEFPQHACEDGDVCTANELCDLAVCAGPLVINVAPMVSPRLTLGRLGAPAGNDTLVVKGKAMLPTPLAISPENSGIDVFVRDAAGATVVTEHVPGGAFNPLTGVGWSITGKGVRYVDKRKIGQRPIKKISIKTDLGTPGLVRFAVSGKAGTYLASPALPLSASVNLGGSPENGGVCATFPGPSPACASGSGGTKVRCR